MSRAEADTARAGASAVRPPAEAQAPPRFGAATWRLLLSELGLLLGRLRIRAGLAVLAAVPVLIAVVVRTFGGPSSPGEGPPFLSDVTQNGLFIAFTSLTVELPLFLPLAVGVVAGDSIAGEAQIGTLRYLLVAPAGRTRLLVVKLLSALVFCFVATVVVAVVGAAIGAALFPLREVALLSGGTITTADALLRGLLVALYVGVSLAGLSAMGVFVSTLTDVPIAAMATTVGLAITSQILDTIPQVSAMHPWLPTHEWFAFGDLLRQPVETGPMLHGIGLQALYVAVFGALSWARFTSRDVLA